MASLSKALPEELEQVGGVVVANSALATRAAEVRANRINWQSYLQSQMITQEQFNVIMMLDTAPPPKRDQFMKEHRFECARTFLEMIANVAKDQTVQYLLTMIDDILQEDRTRVEIFHEYAAAEKTTVWRLFLPLLNRQDQFIVTQASRIIAKLACWSRILMDGTDLHFYLAFLKEQLRMQNNEYKQATARCLQMLLRVDEYRQAYATVDGITTILNALSTSSNFQIQYQLIFCLWCMSFNADLAEQMNKYNVIPNLALILADSQKEKVLRIILATLRNLLEKPEDTQTVQENAVAMVHGKVLKTLSLLQSRKFDDQDIIDDITYLEEKLQASVQDLSSFDEYVSELKSGRLEWSPVHKSERFWRENAQNFNERNYELLKILTRLLEVSKDPLILSVAVHDIGEYVRCYPRGKQIIEQIGGKQLAMTLLTHEDSNVRYQALLAVQKMMVQNWEYLGKQLEQDTAAAGSAAVKGKPAVPTKG
ncbi:V-type proton ATPase subunit H-like [Paramacrobiotus metropolitanus]|uniref:V-type proton ATPase subunit H-like n=1 Tax=Paramacrobiotus metropolitanus TaxID=2943436 RepID=UPI0024459672|nr:V-type proton ATPase subunit H-like [Paramacrobiotus metropolitanus]